MARKNGHWLLLRGVIGSMTLITGFIAVLFIPLIMYSLIISLAILWTGCLRMEWRMWDFFCIIICLSGIIVSILPSLRGFHSAHHKDMIIGVSMALLSSLFSAVLNLILFHVKDEDPRTVTVQNMMCLSTIPLLGMIPPPHMPIMWDDVPWIYLIITAMLTTGSQLSKTHALQKSANVRVVFIRFLDPIMAICWDLFLFHTQFNTHLLIGLLLMCAGILIRCASTYFTPSIVLLDKEGMTHHVADLPEVRDDKDPLKIIL
jgi:drug/metabolite transporter (DMT)-like permease